MTNITMIIPCYNEAKSIPDLFKQIELFNENINFLIINNGSTDDTEEILKKIKIPDKVVLKTKQKNTGYGAGIKFGFSFVKSKYVGWMHADLQQDINVLKNIEKLIKKNMLSNNKNLIAFKGYRTKRIIFDVIFTSSLSFLISILFLKKCRDIAGQPNIFYLKDLTFMNDAPNDHTFEFFIYLKFILAGGNFLRSDAPFLKRKYGVSSWNIGLISKLKHSWVIFKYILNFRLKNF